MNTTSTNTASLGLSLQKIICDIYSLPANDHAKSQFLANYDPACFESLAFVANQIFTESLKLKPIKCTTYDKLLENSTELVPYNFILEDGKTLSIRTTRTSDKISPRVVGQAGIDTFNKYFGEYSAKTITNQSEIRSVIYEKINYMLPTFIEYLLNSDLTVWVYAVGDSFKYVVFDSNMVVNIDFKRENFSFTRTLDKWTESNTLKFNGISIAEIQTHQNRNFKFRFNMKNLLGLIENTIITNETFGITAENTICDICDLDRPVNFQKRSSLSIQREIKPVLVDALTHLPKVIQHTGSTRGERNGQSKCAYDFVLADNMTLSVKTNYGKFVCPPEVGQPSDKTFFFYFGHLIEEGFINEETFKSLVLSKVEKLIPIYLLHLFDSDYLLWLYKDRTYKYQIVPKSTGSGFVWEKQNFSFSAKSIESWNESNTVKYRGITLGEFQFHHNRNCLKFRFHFPNLMSILNGKNL